jgi:hypothetical protein
VLTKVRDVEPVPGDELPERFHPAAGRTKRSTRPRPRGRSAKRARGRSGRGG